MDDPPDGTNSPDPSDRLDDAPCGYIALRDDGTIHAINTTLRLLLGFGSEELEGNAFTALLSAGGRVFYQTHLFPTLKLHGKLEEIYLSLKRRDGTEIPMLLNAVRRHGNTGSTEEPLNECILLTMRQRSLFEEEILGAKKAAEEANVALAKAHEILEAQQKELLVLNAREHHIAEVLQNALRPAISKEVPGLAIHPYYQPALDEAEVGGDYYDVFPVSGRCYALVVADVSGKGLTAAAQVATLRHMLRALLYQQDRTTAQSVASLNEMVVNHKLLDGFATLFVGVYDVAERTLTYVNAGQEPGLLLRPATNQVEEIGPTGPVLGAFAEASFHQAVAQFGAGDVFALFTDGLTEAGANRKDLLEVAGVSDILRKAVKGSAEASDQQTPHDIADRLMAGVIAAVTPAGIRDDVCLLVAKVTQA